MVKTLVTGGTGFVGASVVEKLVTERETVVVLTRNPDYVPRSRRVAGSYYVKGDVFDPKSLEYAMEGCDAVINAVQFENAPFENSRKGFTYERVDGEGTQIQVEVAKKAGVKRFIYMSGAGTKEGRTEPWFKAKLCAEKAVRESGMQWTIFRPSWIYGPQDHSLNKFALFARFLPFIPIIGTGNEKIQPVYVKDVATLIWQALNRLDTAGKIFEVGGPQEFTMREIVQTMLRVSGKRRFILAHPKPLMKFIARLLQYLPSRPLTPEGVDFITMEEKVDTKELLQTFPISLTPLEVALKAFTGKQRKSQLAGEIIRAA